MVRFSEIQQFPDFPKLFPGNFRTICLRFENFGNFGRMVSALCLPFTPSGFLHRSNGKIPVRSFRTKRFDEVEEIANHNMGASNTLSSIFSADLSKVYRKTHECQVFLQNRNKFCYWEHKLKLTLILFLLDLCTTSETLHDLQITVARATQLCRPNVETIG